MSNAHYCARFINRNAPKALGYGPRGMQENDDSDQHSLEFITYRCNGMKYQEHLKDLSWRTYQNYIDSNFK